jgi:hypothetical protein
MNELNSVLKARSKERREEDNYICMRVRDMGEKSKRLFGQLEGIAVCMMRWKANDWRPP